MIQKLCINARFLTQEITGVQRYAIELSLQLKRLMGDQILFVSPKNIKQIDIAKTLGVHVYGRLTGHFWEQFELPVYLKHHGSPLLLNLCNTASICYPNKICAIHDIAFKVYPNAYSKPFLLYYQFLIPKIISKSKALITVSTFSKEEIHKYYHVPSNRIHVIYNAVSSVFQENHISAVLSGKLQDEKYFLAVSSLNYRKNFRSVLEGFEKFHKKFPEYKMYIIGDLHNVSFGNMDLSKYICNKDVRILGRVSDEDLALYYRNAEAFIYPSFYEGFGLPPLEAQSCHTPVIVSDIPVFKEVLLDSVLYCDPYSPQSLCEQMIRVVNDDELRKKLIVRGNKNILRFNWEKSALNLYKKLLPYM